MKAESCSGRLSQSQVAARGSAVDLCLCCGCRHLSLVESQLLSQRMMTNKQMRWPERETAQRNKITSKSEKKEQGSLPISSASLVPVPASAHSRRTFAGTNVPPMYRYIILPLIYLLSTVAADAPSDPSAIPAHTNWAALCICRQGCRHLGEHCNSCYCWLDC